MASIRLCAGRLLDRHETEVMEAMLADDVWRAQRWARAAVDTWVQLQRLLSRRRPVSCTCERCTARAASIAAIRSRSVRQLAEDDT